MLQQLFDIVGIKDANDRLKTIRSRKLRRAIERQRLFQLAVARARGRTTLGRRKFANLYLILTNNLRELPSHDVAEIGVWKGGSLAFMASILASVDPAAKVIGIDSFKGINNAIDALDTHQVGDFSGVAAEEVRHFSSDKHLTNILVTQAELGGGVHQIAASGSLGLVHIDCDTFMSTKAALGASWEAVCEMGYLIVDDVVEPSCLGATLAALDFMFEKEIRPNQMWPHLVIRKNSKRKRD